MASVFSLTLKSIRLEYQRKSVAVRISCVLHDVVSTWMRRKSTYHNGQVVAQSSNQGSIHFGWNICPHGSFLTHVRTRKSSVQIAQHSAACLLSRFLILVDSEWDWGKRSMPETRLPAPLQAAGRGNQRRIILGNDICDDWAAAVRFLAAVRSCAAVGFWTTARSSKLEFMSVSV